MALSTDDLAWVRARIGTTTPPEDADLNTRYDALGTKEAVVEEELRKRLATLVSTSLKVDIQGDVAVDNTANAKILAGLVGDAVSDVNAISGNTAVLYRTDRER